MSPYRATPLATTLNRETFEGRASYYQSLTTLLQCARKCKRILRLRPCMAFYFMRTHCLLLAYALSALKGSRRDHDHNAFSRYHLSEVNFVKLSDLVDRLLVLHRLKDDLRFYLWSVSSAATPAILCVFVSLVDFLIIDTTKPLGHSSRATAVFLITLIEVMIKAISCGTEFQLVAGFC